MVYGDITRLSYLVCPAVISTINHSEDLYSRDKATTKLSRGGATLYITYTLWLFNSSPWKITMLLRTVNHLFRLGPSKNHGELLVITGGYLNIPTISHY